MKLYLDGKIRQWYSCGDGKGVIFLVEAKTKGEARAIMETLPLAKEQLMDHAYIPVGPLMPLRALIGVAAQKHPQFCLKTSHRLSSHSLRISQVYCSQSIKTCSDYGENSSKTALCAHIP